MSAGTQFVSGDPREMRGTTTIYLDTGSDTGHRDTILAAISEALPSVTVAPLFAADLALFYRGAPSGTAIDVAADPMAGFGMVSRPGRDWSVARVLLMRGGTAVHFANSFVALYKEFAGEPLTETSALVC